MKYLVIDASLNGTGIRDYYRGGYIKPDSLGLSKEVTQKLTTWLGKYENAHYDGYIDQNLINYLDTEGREIAISIKNELVDVKICYFSDAKMIMEDF